MSVQLEKSLDLACQNLISLKKFGDCGPRKRSGQISEALSALTAARQSLVRRASPNLETDGMEESDVDSFDIFHRHVSWITSVWFTYDQILSAISDLLGYSYDKPLAFSAFLRCDKDPARYALSEILERYRWSVSIGYALRNIVVHGGKSSVERAIVQAMLLKGKTASLVQVDGAQSTIANTCETLYRAQVHETPDTDWDLSSPISAILWGSFDLTDKLMAICAESLTGQLVLTAGCVSEHAVEA